MLLILSNYQTKFQSMYVYHYGERELYKTMKKQFLEYHKNNANAETFVTLARRNDLLFCTLVVTIELITEMQANPRFLICYKSLMNDIGNGGTRVHSMYDISEKANFLRPMKHRFNFFSSQKGEGGSDGRQRRSGSRNCSDLSGSSCAKQRSEEQQLREQQTTKCSQSRTPYG